ncbi:MAG: hypothetical protein ABIE68_01990 [bacterium]
MTKEIDYITLRLMINIIPSAKDDGFVGIIKINEKTFLIGEYNKDVESIDINTSAVRADKKEVLPLVKKLLNGEIPHIVVSIGSHDEVCTIKWRVLITIPRKKRVQKTKKRACPNGGKK